MTTPPPAYQDPNQAPNAGFPAPPPAAPVKASRKLGGFGVRIVGGIVAFAVIGGGYWVYDQLSGGADTAKVGDCVQNSGSDTNPDVSVISCSDANAKYKVLKVINGTDDTQCQSVPGVSAAYSQSGGRGTSDVVLCLGPNGNG